MSVKSLRCPFFLISIIAASEFAITILQVDRSDVVHTGVTEYVSSRFRLRKPQSSARDYDRQFALEYGRWVNGVKFGCGRLRRPKNSRNFGAQRASAITTESLVGRIVCSAFRAAVGNGGVHRCPFSKLNPRGFIGGCDRLAIACVHGHSDRRSIVGLPKRTPNPHRAGAESDRAAASPSWSSPR